MKTSSRWIIAIVIILSLIIATELWRVYRPHMRTVIHESVRVDTVRVLTPTPTKTITKVERISVPRMSLIYLTDTITDSVLVELPIEQKTYKDSSYTAWVSGYRPKLDSIEVYNKVRTITVTNEVTRNKTKRFGFGLQGGYGFTPKGLQPYVGVGFSITL